MEGIWQAVLKEYGLFGLLILFLMAAYYLQHKSIERKDSAIEKIGKEFSTSLNENTSAIHKSAEANIKLADATQNLVDGFDRQAAQNRQEHGDILGYIRKRSIIR
jgi:transcriptional regulator